MSVKFPDVEVDLIGSDGNAFAILGKVGKAIRKAHGDEAAATYHAEASSGDYDHLLRVTMETVDVS